MSRRGMLLEHGPKLVLALAALVPMVTTPNFFTAGTLGTILALASIVGVLAVGQTFVLIGGGFDLSQGATLALTAAVTAWLATSLGLNPWLAAPFALMIGASLGLINGFSVAWIGTNPFVTTLSTMLIYRGAAFVFLAGQPIRGVDAFGALSRGPTLLGTMVPTRGFIFLGFAVVAWIILRQTLFGQYVYAVEATPTPRGWPACGRNASARRPSRPAASRPGWRRSCCCRGSAWRSRKPGSATSSTRSPRASSAGCRCKGARERAGRGGRLPAAAVAGDLDHDERVSGRVPQPGHRRGHPRLRGRGCVREAEHPAI